MATSANCEENTFFVFDGIVENRRLSKIMTTLDQKFRHDSKSVTAYLKYTIVRRNVMLKYNFEMSRSTIG